MNETNLQRNQSVAYGLGWALVILVVLEVLVGFALTMFYEPTLQMAWHSTQANRGDVPLKYILNFHYWGSAILIISPLLLIVYMLFKGMYAGPYRKLWTGTLLILLGAFVGQVTGNLLPMDQHDVRTVVVEASIIGNAPSGAANKEMVLQGDSITQKTLDAWYWAHRWVVLGFMVLGVLLVGAGLNKAKGASKFMVLLPLIAVAVLSATLPSPSGYVPEAGDYESYNAQPSWYTWPLHGLLNMFSKFDMGWVGAMLIPGLFFLFLLILPFIGRKISPKWARPVFLVFALLFIGAAVGFGGTFAPISGPQETAEYLAELETRKANENATPVNPQLVTQGKPLFATKGCENCHGIDGTKAETAPDLTRVRNRHKDAGYYIRYIKEPKSVNPNSTMPAFKDLTDAELAALADYLRATER